MRISGSSTVCVCVALLCSSAAAQGQFDGATPQTGLTAAMMQLFGKITGFTSEAEMRMIDQTSGETMRVPISLAMLEDKVRGEIDISRVKSKEMPPEAAATLKQIGLDKIVSIVRPDKKYTILAYPSLHAYAESPMSSEEVAERGRKYTMQTTKISTETLDGHRCEKNKVMITSTDGPKHEAVVWNALDLKQFPLQIEMKQRDGTVVMRCTKVQLVKPDAKLFEPPAGFTKQASVEKLMQGAMMKAVGK